LSGAVLTIAQQKGGAGKTTLVAQLAVALAVRGRGVACIDIDPQGSLAAWSELRGRGDARAAIPVIRSPGWKLDLTLGELARAHDVVLVDSPPHAETEARVAIRAARFVLVPCQPSLLDVWASRATLDLVRKEGRAAAVVWNRLPPRGRVVDEARAAAADFGLDALDTGLGNRSDFARSLHAGAGVVESAPRSAAAREIAALTDALTPRLT
jgi:chromosome partitioning protein